MAKKRSDTREDNVNCDKNHLLGRVRFDYISSMQVDAALRLNILLLREIKDQRIYRRYIGDIKNVETRRYFRKVRKNFTIIA